ncbi:hypothetical protein Nmul_A2030 [Nitrosospira multiformis ATCC 25196]|nr:hypothetical protein Nmul_A2030 [Nitrosospira multiformis ATCC 25196]
MGRIKARQTAGHAVPCVPWERLVSALSTGTSLQSAGNAATMQACLRPDQAWSLDFVVDQLSNGNWFRCLMIIDVFTRECLAIEIGQRLSGTDVVTALNRIRQSGRLPGTLFCDNGSEFTSQILDLWAYHNKVKIEFSRPGIQ